MKTIWNMQNMMLQFEGTGKKEEYIKGIRMVYIKLLAELNPMFAEIAESVVFKGKMLITKNTAW